MQMDYKKKGLRKLEKNATRDLTHPQPLSLTPEEVKSGVEENTYWKGSGT